VYDILRIDSGHFCKSTVDCAGEAMDVNVRAFRTVQQAIDSASGVADVKADTKKESSRRGGLIGGPLRARAISAARRVEIAKKASAARWRKRSTK
jgi:hypothetical protein